MFYYYFNIETGVCDLRATYEIEFEGHTCVGSDKEYRLSQVMLVDGKIKEIEPTVSIEFLEVQRQSIIRELSNDIQYQKTLTELVDPRAKQKLNALIAKFKELHAIPAEKLTQELLDSYK